MKITRAGTGKMAALAVCLTLVFLAASAAAQERILLSYSSIESSNSVWVVARDQGFYRKNGLNAELIYIGSTTTSVQSLLAGDVKMANTAGSGVAAAVVNGADILMTACYLNTLPFQLVVHESIKNAQDLKGKTVGISRFGSASDVAARFLVRSLGLTPMQEVPILQVGGATERAAAFRAGKIAGFPAPPGIVALAQGMPLRVLADMADLPTRFEFPFICSATARSLLTSSPDTVKRVTMALIEATHFFKTHKTESERIIAKFSKQTNERFLNDSWTAISKLYEKVPLVTKEGTAIQFKEATAKKPAPNLKPEDLYDDRIVQELERSGFIDRVYKQ